MKRVSLIAINSKFTHSNLALLYLRRALEDTDTYDTTIQAFSINTGLMEILKDIYSKKPEIIALSVYIWNSKVVKALLGEIKKILPDVKIVLGGPEVSYNPQKWIVSYPAAIDRIITGPGEHCIVSVLDDIDNEGHKIVKAPPIPYENTLFPYKNSDFPDMKKKYLYYESSRGCPFKCAYCLSSREDQILDFRSFEKIQKELDFFISHKVKIVKFVDRTFNAKRAHYRPIWQYLIDKKPDIIFHFELHPALLDGADFAILEHAPDGLFQFEIGIQSLNLDTLKAIKRPDNWDKGAENIKRLLKMGKFHIHLDLIAGLPYEDLNSFKGSFNDVYAMMPEHLQLGFLKVLPGTEMAEKQDEYGLKYLYESPYQVLETNWISFDELVKIENIAHVFNLVHNSEKFEKTEKMLVPYFESPFDFFENLTSHASPGIFEHHKDWSKTAGYILEFAKTTANIPEGLALDCLRWDWANISGSNFYPPVIQIDALDEMKQLKSAIKDLFHREKRIPGEISNSEFNGAIIFKSATKTFAEKGLGISPEEEHIYLFINKKEYKKYFHCVVEKDGDIVIR